MSPAEKLEAAADRGQMVLDHYDGDASQRYYRILVDLTAAADAEGVNLRNVAVYAAARVEAWRNGCRTWI